MVARGLEMNDLIVEVEYKIQNTKQVMTQEEKGTLRDQFAMAALTGLLTNPGCLNQHPPAYADYAERVYKYADAMMEARKK